MNCIRCGKNTDDYENVGVGNDGYILCKRCADTFWRRFYTFIGGS